MDSGVLWFDSATYSEFLMELKVDKMKVASKKYKTLSSDDNNHYYETMPRSKIEVQDVVLMFWPRTSVREANFYAPHPKSLHIFFKKAFNIYVTPVGCVTTFTGCCRRWFGC